MVVGFVSLVLAGTLRAALLICRALWAFGVQSWLATCYGGLFGLLFDPLGAAKRAAPLSRPSWVVLPCRRLSQSDASCAITVFIVRRTDVENNLVEVLSGVVRLALIAGVG